MSCNEDLKIKLMFEAERELVKNLTETERYRYYLGRMQYITYKSGKENLLQSDCSGSVCLALLLATGCSVRVTADELFRNYFTKKNPGAEDIQAAFFIYEDCHCDHVAGICGRDVVLNCVEPYSVLRSLSGMKDFYNENGYRIVVRGLDRKALQHANDFGLDLYGADYEFLQISNCFYNPRNGGGIYD